jgi:translation initiation factor IF-1
VQQKNFMALVKNGVFSHFLKSSTYFIGSISAKMRSNIIKVTVTDKVNSMELINIVEYRIKYAKANELNYVKSVILT